MGEIFVRIFFIPIVLLFFVATVNADYKNLFEKEFLTTNWALERPRRSECVDCHMSESMTKEYRSITDEWRKSWHARHNVSCHDCHGGDPDDVKFAMSPERGYIGVPPPAKIPQLCGKCHIRIFEYYMDSGHGKAFVSSIKGPSCVTCHGSHDIQKASIEIIDESKCSRCHSFERAKLMKKALFKTDSDIAGIEKEINMLKSSGAITEDEENQLFRTQAEFRTLFHTIDVDLVKVKTDSFDVKLRSLRTRIEKIKDELALRKVFSIYLMILFVFMGAILLLIMRTRQD